MSSVGNTVHYCCVARSNQILYAYSGGDHEIENLAALCLQKTPLFHAWYFETVGKKTYGFLVEDGEVYFTIVDEGLGSPGILRFLQHVKDEFKKLAKKGSRGSFSGLSSICIQEQLVPVIRGLITSLEHIPESGNNLVAETSLPNYVALSPVSGTANGQTDVLNSTKSPLLGKSSKKEKRKNKEHVIAMRNVEADEHRKSTERGLKSEVTTPNLDIQGGAGSSVMQKDSGSMRIRSGPQNIRKRWCRQVRIVLAIDAAICLILFAVWLFICGGIGCIR